MAHDSRPTVKDTSLSDGKFCFAYMLGSVGLCMLAWAMHVLIFLLHADMLVGSEALGRCVLLRLAPQQRMQPL